MLQNSPSANLRYTTDNYCHSLADILLENRHSETRIVRKEEASGWNGLAYSLPRLSTHPLPANAQLRVREVYWARYRDASLL
jgi:hypothetical protein